MIGVNSESSFSRAILFTTSSLSGEYLQTHINEFETLNQFVNHGKYTFNARGVFPTLIKNEWAALLTSQNAEMTGITTNQWFPSRLSMNTKTNPPSLSSNSLNFQPFINSCFSLNSSIDDCFYCNLCINTFEVQTHTPGMNMTDYIDQYCSTFESKHYQTLCNEYENEIWKEIESIIENQVQIMINNGDSTYESMNGMTACGPLFLNECYNLLPPVISTNNNPYFGDSSSTFPTFFSALRKFKKISTSLFTSSNEMLDMIENDGLSFFKYANTSSELISTMIEMMNDETLPHFSVLHFDDLASSSSQEYNDKLKSIDSMIHQIITTLQSTNHLNETLLIFTSLIGKIDNSQSSSSSSVDSSLLTIPILFLRGGDLFIDGNNNNNVIYDNNINDYYMNLIDISASIYSYLTPSLSSSSSSQTLPSIWRGRRIPLFDDDGNDDLISKKRQIIDNNNDDDDRDYELKEEMIKKTKSSSSSDLKFNSTIDNILVICISGLSSNALISGASWWTPNTYTLNWLLSDDRSISTLNMRSLLPSQSLPNLAALIFGNGVEENSVLSNEWSSSSSSSTNKQIISSIYKNEIPISIFDLLKKNESLNDDIQNVNYIHDYVNYYSSLSSSSKSGDDKNNNLREMKNGDFFDYNVSLCYQYSDFFDRLIQNTKLFDYLYQNNDYEDVIQHCLDYFFEVGIQQLNNNNNNIQNDGDDISYFQKQISFLQIEDLNIAGKQFGYNSDQYLLELEIIDKRLNSLFNRLFDSPLINNTLVIITSDHGGDQKKEGFETPSSSFIPFIAYNPFIKGNNLTNSSVSTRDLSPTIASIFNFDIPQFWTGKIINISFDKYQPILAINPYQTTDYFDKPEYNQTDDDLTIYETIMFVSILLGVGIVLIFIMIIIIYFLSRSRITYEVYGIEDNEDEEVENDTEIESA